MFLVEPLKMSVISLNKNKFTTIQNNVVRIRYWDEHLSIDFTYNGASEALMR